MIWKFEWKKQPSQFRGFLIYFSQSILDETLSAQHTWLKGSLSWPRMAASDLHIFTHRYVSSLYCLCKVMLAQIPSRTSFCIITLRSFKRRARTGPFIPPQQDNGKGLFPSLAAWLFYQLSRKKGKKKIKNNLLFKS